MPYDYTLTAVIPASAREIYDAWLDSLAHSEMTGGRANTSAEVGAEFSAWDGYISGRNLELVPGERIVQSWRTTKFPENHEDSTITVTLEEGDDGTLLTLSHRNVPEGHQGYEQGGWQKSYFEPMIAYFSSEPPVGGEAQEELQLEPAPESVTAKSGEQPVRQAKVKSTKVKKVAAVSKGRPKRTVPKVKTAGSKTRPKGSAPQRKSAAKKRTAVLKPQRKGAAAKTKSKRAAPKAKMAAARRRAKPASPAKTRAKRAGSARRVSAGRRPR